MSSIQYLLSQTKASKNADVLKIKCIKTKIPTAEQLHCQDSSFPAKEHDS